MEASDDPFCKNCVLMMQRLNYAPRAEPIAELLTGSCIWGDERCRRWCEQCKFIAKRLFSFRYRLTVGEPVTPEQLAYFLEVEKQVPAWPFFRPERRSPDIAAKVRHLVTRQRRQTCVNIEREYREACANGTANYLAEDADQKGSHEQN